MIPVELYRGILENLDADGDRVTLLSLSQCCAALREESQRILFQSTDSAIWSRGNLTLRHKKFLEAIVASPQRLALYVKDYSQCGIGWEPGYKEPMKAVHKDYEARVDVYNMTLEAFSVMNNLQKLRYRPLCASRSAHILSHCAFQIQELDWMQPQCEGELACFLTSQRKLRHLTLHLTSSLHLTEGKLPKLVSFSGFLSTLLALRCATPPGQILAFDCLDYTFDLGTLSYALAGIKYLRIPSMLDRNSDPQRNSVPKSVLIVEIACWLTTDIDFKNLPQTLHTLVLRHYSRNGHPLVLSEMKDTASTLFKGGPLLKHVDFCSTDSSDGVRVFRPRTLDGEIRAETRHFGDDNSDWWKSHL